MKEITVRTRQCRFFLEKSSRDGGLLIVTIVPAADGEFLSYRHWYSDPAQARSVYAAIVDAASADERVRRALENEQQSMPVAERVA